MAEAGGGEGASAVAAAPPGAITVEDIRRNRVAPSTKKNYARNCALVLKHLFTKDEEVVAEPFKALFPLPWSKASRARVVSHIEDAPTSCDPLIWERVTCDHVLGE